MVQWIEWLLAHEEEQFPIAWAQEMTDVLQEAKEPQSNLSVHREPTQPITALGLLFECNNSMQLAACHPHKKGERQQWKVIHYSEHFHNQASSGILQSKHGSSAAHPLMAQQCLSNSKTIHCDQRELETMTISMKNGQELRP